MKDKINIIEENKSIGTNLSVGVEPLVSLPTIQINEITHGDSLELAGCVPAKADLILEDMPYNITQNDWDKEPIDLKRYWESRMELIKPTGVICLTASQPFTSILICSNLKMFKHEWIWQKNRGSNFANTVREPFKEHEAVLMFSDGKWTYNKQMQERAEKGKQRVKHNLNWTSKSKNYREFDDRLDQRVGELRVPSSIQKFNVENGLAPTQKPVGLFEYLIRTYTNEGELVFDGFGGSGTTAIAAYRTKRNFIVIEKDKRYFEIASKRLYQERNPLSTFDEAS